MSCSETKINNKKFECVLVVVVVVVDVISPDCLTLHTYTADQGEEQADDERQLSLQLVQIGSAQFGPLL